MTRHGSVSSHDKAPSRGHTKPYAVTEQSPAPWLDGAALRDSTRPRSMTKPSPSAKATLRDEMRSAPRARRRALRDETRNASRPHAATRPACTLHAARKAKRVKRETRDAQRALYGVWAV